MATNWQRLRDPFPAGDVEWRVAQAGEKNGKIWAKVLAYITARAIQDRLDEVFGVAGWKNEYTPGPGGGVVCRLWFRDDNGEWVWREDGAENTDIEAVKGGISGALKRAGAALGIGRYLYDLDEGWAEVHERGRFSGKTKEGKWFKWDPPELPPWALPSGEPTPELPYKPLRDELRAAINATPAPQLDAPADVVAKWGTVTRMVSDPDASEVALRNAAKWVEGIARKVPA